MSWTREQVDEFLAERPLRLGRLATVSADGEPHVVPVWFMPEAGRVLVHTLGYSRKVADIRATGRFAMSVDKDSPPYKGVSFEGRAEVVANDVVDSLDLVRRLAVEHLGPEHGPGAGEGIAGMAGEHVTLVLYPESWEAWDFSQQG